MIRNMGQVPAWYWWTSAALVGVAIGCLLALWRNLSTGEWQWRQPVYRPRHVRVILPATVATLPARPVTGVPPWEIDPVGFDRWLAGGKRIPWAAPAPELAHETALRHALHLVDDVEPASLLQEDRARAGGARPAGPGESEGYGPTALPAPSPGEGTCSFSLIP